MPLLSAADWLKFVVGRSKADQVDLSRMIQRSCYERAGQTHVAKRCSVDGSLRSYEDN